ncbi:MAG: response regulator [Pseudomonadota bacterium]
MTQQSQTVFIVEDDDDVRSSLCRALSLHGYVSEGFSDPLDFLNTFDGSAPGCIVLDYGLPGVNGLDLQKWLIERQISTPIIFITGHGGVPESVRAIQAGAIDFLEKPFKISILIQRIDTAFGLDAQFRAEQKQRSRRTTLLNSLTEREAEVLYFVLENPSTVSSKEIARALAISPRTAEIHRARLLQKLDVNSLVELVAIYSSSERDTGLRNTGRGDQSLPEPDPRKSFE